MCIFLGFLFFSYNKTIYICINISAKKEAYDKNNTSLLQPHGKRKQNYTFKSDKDLRYPERDTLFAIYVCHSVLERRKKYQQQPHYLSSNIISKATWIFLKRKKKYKEKHQNIPYQQILSVFNRTLTVFSAVSVILLNYINRMFYVDLSDTQKNPWFKDLIIEICMGFLYPFCIPSSLLLCH